MIQRGKGSSRFVPVHQILPGRDDRRSPFQVKMTIPTKTHTRGWGSASVVPANSWLRGTISRRSATTFGVRHQPASPRRARVVGGRYKWDRFFVANMQSMGVIPMAPSSSLFFNFMCFERSGLHPDFFQNSRPTSKTRARIPIVGSERILRLLLVRQDRQPLPRDHRSSADILAQDNGGRGL